MKKSIKSILSISVVIAMLVSMTFISTVSVSAAASTTRVVTLAEAVNGAAGTTIKAGDTVTVTVTLDQSVNLEALSYNLYFDPSVFELDHTINADYGEENWVGTDFQDAFMLALPTKRFGYPAVAYGTAPGNTVNTINVAGTKDGCITSNTTNWNIGQFYLKVKAGVASGSTKINFINTLSKDYNLDSVAFGPSPLPELNLTVQGDITPTPTPVVTPTPTPVVTPTPTPVVTPTPTPVVTPTPTPVPTAAAIAIGDASVNTGSTVAVPVVISNVDKINNANIVVNYDATKLTFDDVTYGTGFVPQQSNKNANTAGTVEIGFADATGISASSSTGVELLYLHFTAKDIVGDTPITIASAQYGNGGTGYLDFSTKTNGTITINEVIPYDKGDVTENGTIDSNDAVWILQNIAGTKTLNAEQLALADFNNDGSVNALDASDILIYELGLQAQ